jgi:hypothetical protein
MSMSCIHKSNSPFRLFKITLYSCTWMEDKMEEGVAELIVKVLTLELVFSRD